MPYKYQIPGTIIASILDYDELCALIKENHTISNTSSSYVPCDGRSILGSKLANTGVSNAPDLRGRFLRGLNVMYNHGDYPVLDLSSADPDGSERQAGTYQSDELKTHSHAYGARHTGGGMNGGGSGDLCLNRETSETGGTETRPRNIAVYYYIKIN